MRMENLNLESQILINNITQRTISHLGGKGTGKTTIIRRVLDILPAQMPCLVFDPLNIIESKHKFVVSRRSNIFGGIFARVVNSLLEKNNIIIISFDNLLGSEINEFVEKFVPNIRMTDGMWIFDEIHEFTPQNMRDYSVEIERVIRHTRNDNNGVWITSQRPAFTAKNVLALTDFLILSRLTWPNDLEVAKGLIPNIPERDSIIETLQGKGFLEGFGINFDANSGSF